MKKLLHLLILSPLLALSLSGCFLFESKQTRALRASPDYRSGYGDGCASVGTVSANPRADTLMRDDQAYAGNAAYRMGWNEGYGACRPMQSSPIGGMSTPRY